MPFAAGATPAVSRSAVCAKTLAFFSSSATVTSLLGEVSLRSVTQFPHNDLPRQPARSRLAFHGAEEEAIGIGCRGCQCRGLTIG